MENLENVYLNALVDTLNQLAWFKNSANFDTSTKNLLNENHELRPFHAKATARPIRKKCSLAKLNAKFYKKTAAGRFFYFILPRGIANTELKVYQKKR